MEMSNRYYGNRYDGEEEFGEGNAKKIAHPFDDIQLLHPYLNQDKYWCDRYGVYLEIAQMELTHALNSLRLLRDKESELLFTLQLMGQADKKSILEYPLAIALIERVRESKEVKYPWEIEANRKKAR
jgi:hypothetical protein